MQEAAEALLAVYVSDEHATAALDRVVAHMRSGSLKVVDLGILRRDLNGKISLERAPATTEDAGVSQSSAVAGLVGLIFPPSALVSSIDGGAIGMVATQLKPTGIDVASLRRIGAMLDPGESAILAVVNPSSVQAVERALGGFEHVVRSRLSRPPAPDVAAEAADEDRLV